MKGKYICISAILLVIVFLIASCHLGTPDLALRVVNQSYEIMVGGDVKITFELENTGSEYLEDCKVKWFVDDVDSDASDDDIEYDEITNWVPTFGTSLGAGKTSSVFTIDTESGIFGSGVNFYGIYEMGWNYSPDE